MTPIYGKKRGQNIPNSSSLGVSFFNRIPERFFQAFRVNFLDRFSLEE